MNAILEIFDDHHLDPKGPPCPRVGVPVRHHVLGEGVLLRVLLGLCVPHLAQEVAPDLTNLIDQLPAGGVQVPGHGHVVTRRHVTRVLALHTCRLWHG